jgi:hypothetical protein
MHVTFIIIEIIKITLKYLFEILLIDKFQWFRYYDFYNLINLN